MKTAAPVDGLFAVEIVPLHAETEPIEVAV